MLMTPDHDFQDLEVLHTQPKVPKPYKASCLHKKILAKFTWN